MARTSSLAWGSVNNNDAALWHHKIIFPILTHLNSLSQKTCAIRTSENQYFQIFRKSEPDYTWNSFIFAKATVPKSCYIVVMPTFQITSKSFTYLMASVCTGNSKDNWCILSLIKQWVLPLLCLVKAALKHFEWRIMHAKSAWRRAQVASTPSQMLRSPLSWDTSISGCSWQCF